MCSSPLNILTGLHWTTICMSMSFILWNPKLDTVLQMPSQKCRRMGVAGQRNHFLWPAGYTLASVTTGCPERLWSLYPWRYSKLNWAGSWTTCSRWPHLSRGVDRIVSRGPLQPQAFCDTTQDAPSHLCCKGTLIIHVPLAVHQNTQVFFSKAAFFAVIFHFR